MISATTTTTASSRWRATMTTTTASSRRATTTTTTTRADIFFFDSLLKGEEPPNTGGGRVFLPRCITWSSGHTPAPGAPGYIFRHALSFCGVSCMYEEFHNKNKKKIGPNFGFGQGSQKPFFFSRARARDFFSSYLQAVFFTVKLHRISHPHTHVADDMERFNNN